MTQPYERIMILDFETRWNRTDLGFSTQTTEEYVRDPRFKSFGVGYKFLGDKRAHWVTHKDLPAFFESVDWGVTAACCHNCVTGDHEVRTPRGWVRFDQLLDTDEVMQWNPLTEELSFTPCEVVRKKYTGPLYAWNTFFHQGQYTPNHRMFYKTPSASSWRVATAEAVAQMGANNTYVPVGGTYTPATSLDVSPALARVIEMSRADGHVAKGALRFKFSKQRKVTRCKALLDAVGIRYRVFEEGGAMRRESVVCISTYTDEHTKKVSVLLGSGKEKKLDAWVLELSIPARQALLDETQYWDGGVASKKGKGATHVHSAKASDVLWLSDVAIMTGSSARYVLDKPNTRGYSRADSVLSCATLRQRNRCKLVTPAEKAEFSGTVYCVTVPTEAFLIRRNGATWVTGNSKFDAAIMSWIYDAHPCFILDTLSMARALYGVNVGNSAAKLAVRFGLPPKGTALNSTEGLEEITEVIEKELAAYCMDGPEGTTDDVRLCELFLERMLPEFPTKELRLIDMTIKMFTEPKLILDRQMLADALLEERTKREGLLKRLGAGQKDLGNNDKMACFLAELGVAAPKKKSPANPENMIYAFAKKDAGMQQLLASDDEDVVALCEARLMVKSSGERTRAQRFVDIAERGTLPVPLRYYAAHTGRWGGDEQINMQNLKRGGPLRNAIMAPDGYQICVMDLSQIECRVLASLADFDSLLAIFRAKQDAYSLFGRTMFGIPTLNKIDNPAERQAAKSAMLGAGFGISWQTFAGHQLVGFLGADPVLYSKAFAKQMGVTSEDLERFLGWDVNLEKMAAITRNCTDQELLIHCLVAKKIVENYRASSKPVVDFWALCDQLIERCLFAGGEQKVKCLEFSKEKIRLPSGMYLKYPDLRKEKDKEGKMQWVFGESGGRLWGSRLVENIVQSVARVVMTDGMLRIQKRYSVCHTVHDEVCMLVPDDEVEEALVWTREQMIVEPRYLPGIPLDAEGGANRRYGKAKK